jgi:hypothetical protein
MENYISTVTYDEAMQICSNLKAILECAVEAVEANSLGVLMYNQGYKFMPVIHRERFINISEGGNV